MENSSYFEKNIIKIFLLLFFIRIFAYEIETLINNLNCNYMMHGNDLGVRYWSDFKREASIMH